MKPKTGRDGGGGHARSRLRSTSRSRQAVKMMPETGTETAAMTLSERRSIAQRSRSESEIMASARGQRRKRERPRAMGASSRDLAAYRTCPAPRVLPPLPQISQTTLRDLAEKRRQAARSQDTAQKQLSARAGRRNVAFDPLDPVAMLEATREARARPFVHPDSTFVANIEVIDEERLVPLTYLGAQLLEAEMEALAEAKRQEKAKADKEAVALLRHEEIKATERAFAASRLRLEEQVGNAILEKVASRGVRLWEHLRQLDLRDSGYVNAEDFRAALQTHRAELGFSVAECDKLTEQVLHGDLVRYELLRITPLETPKLKRTRSAVDMQLDTLRETAQNRASRHQFASVKHHSTTRLLRPATGTEGFFPENERLVTTTQRPADECLSPVRIEQATRLAASKRAGLQAHLARFAEIQAADQKAARDREDARQRHLLVQRERYLVPIELQAQRDLARALKPRGKRKFRLPARMDPKVHQVEQRIGEEDARTAYAVYESRTRTKEWQEVFGIRNDMLQILASRRDS